MTYVALRADSSFMGRIIGVTRTDHAIYHVAWEDSTITEETADDIRVVTKFNEVQSIRLAMGEISGYDQT